MTGRRSYGQSCPIAHALDLVGDRWALLVIRELRLGPRRFADLQAALPRIGPSVLSQRLSDLVASGVCEQRPLPAPARGEMYALTPWGADLEPVFAELARWSVRSPVVKPRGPVSDDAVMLGVRTFLQVAPAAKESLTAELQVRLSREGYRVIIEKGRLVSLRRSEEPGADTLVRSDAATIQALLIGRITPAAAQSSESLTITGDPAPATWLLDRLAGAAVPPGAAPP